MTLRLNGSTSGYTEIDAPAVAGSNTLVLPTGNGSSGQVLSTNGSGTLSWATVVQPSVALTAATAVASTSGTSIDFTGIPSGVKRIMLMFYQTSKSGGSSLLVQLGKSSGVVTTGYNSTSLYTGGGSGNAGSTSGFIIYTPSAGDEANGSLICSKISGDIWVVSGNFAPAGSANINWFSAGSVDVGGTLDRVRFTTTNGTDTFDKGTVNIMYEG
jgi:hypothetical protein